MCEGDVVLEHGLWDARSNALRVLGVLVGWMCLSGCRVPCERLVWLSECLELCISNLRFGI